MIGFPISRTGQGGTVFAVSKRLPDLPPAPRPERAVFRLRKWIILRLVSLVDNLHAEKEEALIEEVARYRHEMCLDPNCPRGQRPLV